MYQEKQVLCMNLTLYAKRLIKANGQRSLDVATIIQVWPRLPQKLKPIVCWGKIDDA